MEEGEEGVRPVREPLQVVMLSETRSLVVFMK